MGLLEQRLLGGDAGQPRVGAWRGALEARPAVVGAEADVDLLVLVLADVGDHDLAPRSNENRHGLRRPLASAHRPARRVDPQQLAEPGSGFWACSYWCRRRRRRLCQPQQPSGPTWSWPPLWLAARVYGIEAARRSRVATFGSASRAAVLADLDLAVGLRREVHVEAPDIA